MAESPSENKNQTPVAPADKEPQQKKEEGFSPIQSLRTFKTDASRFISEKGVTLSTIVAENEKRKRERAEIRRPGVSPLKKIFITLIIFALIGVGAIIFLGRGEEDEQISFREKPARPSVWYPVFDEREVAVSQPSDFLNAWQPMLERNFASGQMLALFLFHERRNVFLSAGDFFELLSVSAPSSLERAFQEPWTLGVFGTKERAQPVFLIPVSSFQDAFKGMLEWEKDLPFALRNILPKNHPGRMSFEPFQDTFIANQSVRLLINEKEEVLFAYTFFDRRILIMSTSPEVLEAVIQRFLLVPPLKETAR